MKIITLLSYYAIYIFFLFNEYCYSGGVLLLFEPNREYGWLKGKRKEYAVHNHGHEPVLVLHRSTDYLRELLQHRLVPISSEWRFKPVNTDRHPLLRYRT